MRYITFLLVLVAGCATAPEWRILEHSMYARVRHAGALDAVLSLKPERCTMETYSKGTRDGGHILDPADEPAMRRLFRSVKDYQVVFDVDGRHFRIGPNEMTIGDRTGESLQGFMEQAEKIIDRLEARLIDWSLSMHGWDCGLRRAMRVLGEFGNEVRIASKMGEETVPLEQVRNYPGVFSIQMVLPGSNIHCMPKGDPWEHGTIGVMTTRRDIVLKVFELVRE